MQFPRNLCFHAILEEIGGLVTDIMLGWPPRVSVPAPLLDEKPLRIYHSQFTKDQFLVMKYHSTQCREIYSWKIL